MREIKFRGHNGIEWLYDSQISIIPYGKNVHCFMPNEKNKSDQNDVCNWDSVSYVGQYTGCKDANGKEIYEGDILKCKLYNGKYENYLVVWDKEDACFDALNSDKSNFMSPSIWHEFEIIGNVYENKELLEGK